MRRATAVLTVVLLMTAIASAEAATVTSNGKEIRVTASAGENNLITVTRVDENGPLDAILSDDYYVFRDEPSQTPLSPGILLPGIGCEPDPGGGDAVRCRANTVERIIASLADLDDEWAPDPVSMDGAASTRVEGGSGNDVLRGTRGRDTLNGARGDDEMFGRDGVDQLVDTDYSGTDVLNGGDGFDVADYGTRTDDLTLTLDGLANDGANCADSGFLCEGDRIEQVEKLAAGTGHDTLVGDGGRNIIEANDGDDSVRGGGGNDTLVGQAGNDTLIGEAGDDELLGWSGADTLSGGDGADTLAGEDNGQAALFPGLGSPDPAGNDTLRGGAGSDVLLGEGADDRLVGGEGSDRLSGGDGQDTADYEDKLLGVGADIGGDPDGVGCPGLTCEGDTIETSVENLAGGAGDDRLTGTDGQNRLSGRAGADVLDGGLGSDELNGNDGSGDVVSYAGRTEDVTVTLDGQPGDGQEGENDSVAADVEGATGGAGDDSLLGNGEANALRGQGGDDVLNGGLGADVLHGGEGDEDLVTYADRSQDLTITVGDDLPDGAGCPGLSCEGDDVEAEWVDSGSGNDRLTGSPGNERLRGGGGTDVLDGGLGADDLWGEDGTDTAVYSRSATDVVKVTLDGLPDDGISANGSSEGDNVHTDVENLRGGAERDIFVGSPDPGRFEGGAGDDELSGAAARDVLIGGDGADTLDGGADNDVLDGGLGADLVRGGAGVDTADYSNRSAGVTITLADNEANDGQGCPGLTCESDNVQSDVENVTGGAGADQLIGSDAANLLVGGGGSDSLAGGAGDDTLAIRDGELDDGQCGTGADYVEADALDTVAADCETVRRSLL